LEKQPFDLIKRDIPDCPKCGILMRKEDLLTLYLEDRKVESRVKKFYERTLLEVKSKQPWRASLTAPAPSALSCCQKSLSQLPLTSLALPLRSLPLCPLCATPLSQLDLLWLFPSPHAPERPAILRDYPLPYRQHKQKRGIMKK